MEISNRNMKIIEARQKGNLPTQLIAVDKNDNTDIWELLPDGIIRDPRNKDITITPEFLDLNYDKAFIHRY